MPQISVVGNTVLVIIGAAIVFGIFVSVLASTLAVPVQPNTPVLTP